MIYLHEGNKIIESFLNFDFGISFITEVELLGYGNLTKTEEKKLRDLIKDCYVIEWNSKIKDQTIALRKKYRIKYLTPSWLPLHL